MSAIFTVFERVCGGVMLDGKFERASRQRANWMKLNRESAEVVPRIHDRFAAHLLSPKTLGQEVRELRKEEIGSLSLDLSRANRAEGSVNTGRDFTRREPIRRQVAVDDVAHLQGTVLPHVPNVFVVVESADGCAQTFAPSQYLRDQRVVIGPIDRLLMTEVLDVGLSPRAFGWGQGFNPFEKVCGAHGLANGTILQRAEVRF